MNYLIQLTILLIALPAFAEEHVKTTQAAGQQGIGAGIVGVGSFEVVYSGYHEVKTIERNALSAKVFTDEYEKIWSQKNTMSKVVLQHLDNDIRDLGKVIGESESGSQKWAAAIQARDAKLAARDSLKNALSESPQWKALDKQFHDLVMTKGTEAINNEKVGSIYRRGLVRGVAGIAAGSAVYYMAHDEKIEERQPASAPAAEAPAEEEKVPSHISSQLDAAQDNPF